MNRGVACIPGQDLAVRCAPTWLFIILSPVASSVVSWHEGLPGDVYVGLQGNLIHGKVMFDDGLNCFPINLAAQGPDAGEMLEGGDSGGMQRTALGLISCSEGWFGICVCLCWRAAQGHGLQVMTFYCGSFPNSWVWTWRSWKKLKKMLGWEMEAWAAWQVIRVERSTPSLCSVHGN